MRWAVCLAVFAATAGVLPADPKDVAVRALDVTVESPAKGKATEPTVIRSADELAKAISDKAAVAAVKKAVDFDKEQVVYFAWAGSGQDQVTAAGSVGAKGLEVTFTYAPGRTRDLRTHARLFAVPKGATYKVVTAGR
ncbi:MAG: hypothetical protein J2P46_11035 [Zavarzinella sp.]|nr:hypothetical protein [Zavarzinella sp.]